MTDLYTSKMAYVRPKSNIALNPYGYVPRTRVRMWNRNMRSAMRAMVVGMLVTFFVAAGCSFVPTQHSSKNPHFYANVNVAR